MDYVEEQTQELEVLESIYPDELTVLSPTHFFIILSLDTETDRKHFLKLEVNYTSKYPEEVPQLHVKLPKEDEIRRSEASDTEQDDDSIDSGSDSGSDSEKPILFLAETVEFDEKDLQLLQSKCYDEAQENLGMASVFGVVSNLKESAEELFKKKVDAAQKVYDDKLMEKEMEEQKKFHGTKVTKESFNSWRAAFRKEMGWDTREEERLRMLHKGKMTGKEIFEKGLSGAEAIEV